MGRCHADSWLKRQCQGKQEGQYGAARQHRSDFQTSVNYLLVYSPIQVNFLYSETYTRLFIAEFHFYRRRPNRSFNTMFIGTPCS